MQLTDEGHGPRPTAKQGAAAGAQRQPASVRSRRFQPQGKTKKKMETNAQQPCTPMCYRPTPGVYGSRMCVFAVPSYSRARIHCAPSLLVLQQCSSVSPPCVSCWIHLCPSPLVYINSTPYFKPQFIHVVPFFLSLACSFAPRDQIPAPPPCIVRLHSPMPSFPL